VDDPLVRQPYVVCHGKDGGNGPKGDKGDKGDNGNHGDKGDKGDNGNHGDKGGQRRQGRHGQQREGSEKVRLKAGDAGYPAECDPKPAVLVYSSTWTTSSARSWTTLPVPTTYGRLSRKRRRQRLEG